MNILCLFIQKIFHSFVPHKLNLYSTLGTLQTSSVPKIKSTDYVVAYIKFSDTKTVSEKEASYWNKIEKIAVFDGYIVTYINESPDTTLNVVLKT